MATATIAPREVRAELARWGMSQADLAAASGITERTLTRRLSLSNPEPFRLDELDAIAAAFSVSVTSLLRGPDKAAA